MKNKKGNNAFTLIELIAVLVILAILALIVTPLVLNIVKSAKKSANERSIDEYGKAVELAAATYLLDTGKKANNFNDLKVEYSGNEVKCNISEVYKNNVFLSQCSVNGKEVKNSKTSDGYYHYGDATKFVDMYGDAVKKAVVRYQKDKKEMPTNLNELTINADGLNVTCNTNKINSDGTVYLSSCSLNNFVLKDDNTNDNYYHYGEVKYLIGDKVHYNGIEFYVIENVGDESDTVHLLKAEPIKASEIVDLLNSTEIGNKVDTSSKYITMAYYFRDNCVSAGDISGCTTDYSLSDIKQVVDVWANNKFNNSDLKADKTGYSVRLITYDELIDNLGYGDNGQGTILPYRNGNTPDWVYNSNYRYWTMSSKEDSASDAWCTDYRSLNYYNVAFRYSSVRPVINLKKSSIEE